MRQFTNTYRITLSDETKVKLTKLRKYKIKPTAFIRLAIEEKMQRDLPKLKVKQPKEEIPF